MNNDNFTTEEIFDAVADHVFGKPTMTNPVEAKELVEAVKDIATSLQGIVRGPADGATGLEGLTMVMGNGVADHPGVAGSLSDIADAIRDLSVSVDNLNEITINVRMTHDQD
jgi:uncharacterized protein YoxC